MTAAAACESVYECRCYFEMPYVTLTQIGVPWLLCDGSGGRRACGFAYSANAKHNTHKNNKLYATIYNSTHTIHSYGF